MSLEWWQALILGAVQGLTEFLPVSSSGHLVLVPDMLAWPSPGLIFDALVHGGTAGALVVVFRRELVAMVRGLAGRGGADARLARRLAGLIVLGTLPVIVVGLTLRGPVEAAFQASPAAATGLFGTAAILVAGERWRTRRVARAQIADAPAGAAVSAGDGEGDRRHDDGSEDPDPPRAQPGGPGAPATLPGSLQLGSDPADPRGTTLDRLTPVAALLIGAGQALAVLPGISRSGTTIMAGVVTGLTREAATRFAFLLALPALAGAVVLSAAEVAVEGAGDLGWAGLAAAVVVAFVTGMIAIRWLLRLVARTPLTGFAGYCVAAGVVGWLSVLMLGTGGP